MFNQVNEKIVQPFEEADVSNNHSKEKQYFVLAKVKEGKREHISGGMVLEDKPQFDTHRVVTSKEKDQITQ